MRCRSVALLTILAGLVLGGLADAAPVAPHVPSGTDSEMTVRVFKDLGSFTGLAELSALNQNDNRAYRAAQLGGYYGLSENWNVGAFYRRAYGLRHDDDWQKPNAAWSWIDSRHRGEDILLLDATGKFLLNFLSVEHWVAEVKTRFSENLFNHNQDLMVRPGLTYFWIRSGQPFVNFFVQYEMDFATNYAERELNERWAYVGGLYRINSYIDVGGFFANQWQAWHSSRAYLGKGGTPYTVSATSQVFTALLVVHL